jgi:tRNA threonylcarbamoyladenosine biosynthesis protein TsaB
MILSIETSHGICSVCLDDGNNRYFRQAGESFAHGRLLTVFIKEVMQEAGCLYSRLDAVAYSAGPGSYTGLRIGASVAKGLCWAADRPLLAVPTLQAMALYAAEKTGYYGEWLVWLNARNHRVYSGSYQGRELNEVTSPHLYTVSPPFSIEKRCVVLDEPKLIDELCVGNPEQLVVSEHSAKEVAAIARVLYIKKDFVDVKQAEPHYITGFGKQF